MFWGLYWDKILVPYPWAPIVLCSAPNKTSNFCIQHWSRKLYTPQKCHSHTCLSCWFVILCLKCHLFCFLVPSGAYSAYPHAQQVAGAQIRAGASGQMSWKEPDKNVCLISKNNIFYLALCPFLSGKLGRYLPHDCLQQCLVSFWTLIRRSQNLRHSIRQALDSYLCVKQLSNACLIKVKCNFGITLDDKHKLRQVLDRVFAQILDRH